MCITRDLSVPSPHLQTSILPYCPYVAQMASNSQYGSFSLPSADIIDKNLAWPLLLLNSFFFFKKKNHIHSQANVSLSRNKMSNQIKEKEIRIVKIL